MNTHMDFLHPSQPAITPKTQRRLLRVISSLSLLTLTLQMTGVGYTLRPVVARAETIQDVTRPDAPNPTLEQFVQQSLANTQVETQKIQTDAASAELSPESGNPLYAWDRTPNPGWSHGQISGYYETEDIPFQLELNGLTGGTSTTVNVRMEYKRSGIVGLEAFRHPDATTEPGLVFNTDRTPFTMGAPSLSTISGVQYKTYAFTFTPSGTTASLYWDALIALGAHNYPGASLDVRYQEGSKTVPIATNEFLYNTFTINKWDTADPIFVGETTNYHIQFVNTGNAPALNVVVTDVLPAGLSYVSTVDSNGGIVQVNGQTITTTFASVDQATGREIVLEVRGDVAGRHTNPASVVSSFQPNPTTDTEDTTVVQGNPRLPLACGLDIGLVIDSSGSIDSTELTQMKNAYRDFVDALLVDNNTPTQFSVVEFDTNVVTPTLGFTSNATTIKNDINAAVSDGWTNWEDALLEAHNQYDPRADKPDLVIFASDGNPNTIGVTPPSSGGTATETTAVNAAVARANAIKADGIRILSIAIGDQLDVPNLQAISGTTVYPDDTSNLLDADVVKTNFSQLAQDLADLAIAQCGGTITVQKLIIGQPEQGWDFAANVTGGTPTPASGTTDANGQLTFDISDINGGTATASVIETLQNGYSVDSASCTKNQQPVGTFNGTDRVNGVTVGPNDIVSCTFTNSRDTGTITVVKHVINDNGGTKVAGDFTMNVTGTNVSDPSFPGSEAGTVVTVDAGAYSVDESVMSGYAKSLSADCSGTIAKNEQKTCTITNNDIAPQLTVIKHVVNDNGGIKVAADFTMNVTGTNVSTPSFPGSEAGTTVTLNAGAYSVDENTVAGYAKGLGTNCSGTIALGESKTCTVTNNDNAASLTVIKHVINDNGGTKAASNFTMQVTGSNVSTPSFPGNESGTTVTLNAGAFSVDEASMFGYAKSLGTDCSGTIANGEHKTCTVTNNDIQPKLTVTKIVVNDNGGTKQVSDFPLFVDGTSVTSGVQNGFHADTYLVSETNLPGYASAISGDCATDGAIALNVGDVKSCTITNNDIAPQLTVIKHVINDNGGTKVAGDFTMNVTGTNVSTPSFAGNEAGTTVTLDEGSYSVDESSMTGYAKSLGQDCSGTIAAGEHKTCTITNNDIQPKLTVTKVVINDNGGTKAVSDFPLFVDDTSVTSGVQNGFDVNTYTVSETQQFGYTGVISGDCATNGSITLNIGDEKICTITNNDIQPRLTVYKLVNNENGGDAIPENFTLRADGTNVNPSVFPGSSTGTLVSLDQGSYAVTEDAFPGYTPVFSSDCTGSIGVGETKSCTVTNNSQAAHLIVIKHVINDDGGLLQSGDFSLTINDVYVPSGATFNGQEAPGTDKPVFPGSYSVTENELAGYTASYSQDCTGTIALGETKICTVTNNDQAGSLTVIKHVVNDNNGTKVAGDFTMNVTGTNVSDPSFPGDEAGTTVTLNAGAYSVDEAPVFGYAKSLGANCSGTIANGEHKTCTITNNDIQPKLTVTKTVINNNGGTKAVSDFPLFVDDTSVTSGIQNGFNVGAYVVSETQQYGYEGAIGGDCAANGTITLNPGDVKSCTITNNDIQPRLTVTKIVVNDNGGTKAVSDFPLFVDDTPVISGVQNGFNANTYEVSETEQFGYAGTIGGDCDSEGSVTLVAGDVKTCTITNNDIQPKLTVTKIVTNDNGGNAVVSDFPLFVDDTSVTSGVQNGFDADTYTVSETQQYGYEGAISGDCATNGAITLNVGDIKSCTVTNNDIAPQLTVIKHVINDNGGTQVAADFTMQVTGTNVSNPSFAGSETGTTLTLNQGAYSVDENAFAGYAKSLGTNCSGTINVGDHKTCTVTNDDIQPKLTVTKVVTNDNGGNKQVSDFPLFVDDTSVTSGEQNGFDAASYTVSETGLASYTSAISGDCDEEGDITLNPGDVKSCTITNDDKIAEIDVQKDAPATVQAGGTITYTITWNVLEPGFAKNAVLTDTLPANAQYVASDCGTTAGTCTLDDTTPGTVTWNLGDRSAPDSGTVTVTVRTNNPEVNGTNVHNDVAFATDDLKPVIDDADTTVLSDFSVEINKIAPETVEAGAEMEYILQWSVSGNAFADQLTITDPLPANTSFVSASDGGTESAGTVTWNLGNKLPGDNGFVTLKVKVATPLVNATLIDNTGTLCGTVRQLPTRGDSVQPNSVAPVTQHCDDDTTTTTVHSAPIITIAKSDAPDPVQAGAQLTYTLAWTVAGNSPATNLTITDPVPANTTFVSAANGGTFDATAKVVTWALGNHVPGDSGSVSFVVTVAAPLANNTLLTNTATIDSDENTPVSDTETTTVASASTLSIVKTDSADPVKPGDPLTYTLAWTVAGNSPVTNLVITDTLPTQLTFVSASNSGTYDAATRLLSWSLGNHVPGDTGSVTVNVTVSSDLSNGAVITNTATVDADETTPASDTETTTITAAPILSITKSVNLAFANPGDTATYTVTVKNTGNDAAINATLTDTLPAGFTFVDGGLATKTFALGTIAKGASVTVTYNVKIDAAKTAGTYENLATAKADNHGSVTAKAPLEVRVPVVVSEVANPALTLQKSVSEKLANPGTTIAYVVTIGNGGNAIAKNVRIEDTLPPGFVFADTKSASRNWAIGDLLAGEIRTLTYDVIIGDSVKAGVYKNLVVALADGLDPLSATAPVEVRVPKVLGALVNTGASTREILVFSLGMLYLVFGTLGLRKARKLTA